MKQQSKTKKLSSKKLPAKPAVHGTSTHHFRKSRIRWLSVGTVAAVFGLLLIAFIVLKPFREQVDDWYYDVYAKYRISPTLDALATSYKNVAYCGTSSRYQKLDVYTPKRPGGPFPAVIYVHGGGWAVGDKVNANITTYGTDIVRNGMALVSVNYRLAPAYRFPVQNQDVACAVSYIQHHATDFKIDPNNVGLWGDSAGGQLVAMAALDPTIKKTHTVKGVVEFYGTADLWSQINRMVGGVIKPDKRVITYLGSATSRKLANAASPVYADLNDAPPFLLFHGTNDQTVPYSQSIAFQQKLLAAGDEVTLRSVEHANHNFSAVSQPSASAIKDEMIRFFKEKMR